MNAPDHAGLELETDAGFVKTERRIQRIGIGLMVLFVVAGALGVFGDGPVSRASAHATGLDVAYQRLTRQSVHSTITVDAAAPEVARIAFDRSFIQHLVIHEMRPAQVEMQQENDRVVFVVPAVQGVARLELRIEPLRPGLHGTRVSTESGVSVRLQQLVFF